MKRTLQENKPKPLNNQKGSSRNFIMSFFPHKADRLAILNLRKANYNVYARLAT